MEDVIKKHWKDPDFDKIRSLLLNYVVENLSTAMDEEDRYLLHIAYVMGISTDNSEDGWDSWWEKSEDTSVKYIAEWMKKKKLV